MKFSTLKEKTIKTIAYEELLSGDMFVFEEHTDPAMKTNLGYVYLDGGVHFPGNIVEGTKVNLIEIEPVKISYVYTEEEEEN